MYWASQVHSKRRARMLHAVMRDLVYVNLTPSSSKKKKATEQEIPLWGKLVVDILEDGENEWITGVAPIVDKPQDHEDEGVEEQGAAAGQAKRKRVARPRTRKRTRGIIDITDGNGDELEPTSSSDAEDDDMGFQPKSVKAITHLIARCLMVNGFMLSMYQFRTSELLY